MSDERPFPPSDQKLAKLRSAGIFARTPELFLLAVTAALLVAVLSFDRSGAHGTRAFFEDQFRKGELTSGGREAAELWGNENLRELLLVVGRLLTMPLLATVLLVLLAGLFQSRFLLLSPRFEPGRIFRGLAGWGGQLRPRARSALIRLAQLLAIVALGYLASLSLIAVLTGPSEVLVPAKIPFDPQLVSGDTRAIAKGIAVQSEVLRVAREQLAAATEQFTGTLVILVAFTALLAVVCRFASVLAFRREQGMSREELQTELRESEPSPEMRSAVRDLSSAE